MAKNPRYDYFQKTLVTVRQKSNLTQQDIAVRLGRPQSFVSKYESGERRLDVIEFLEVCKALKITPSSILKKIEVLGD